MLVRTERHVRRLDFDDAVEEEGGGNRETCDFYRLHSVWC